MGSSLSCCCKGKDKALCEFDNNNIEITCCQKSNNNKKKKHNKKIQKETEVIK